MRYRSFLILLFTACLALFSALYLGRTLSAGAAEIDADRPAVVSVTASATEVTTDTTTPINICTQNPAKCPLDADRWPGESDAWQRTGKKWWRHSGTTGKIDIVWEWSAPYSGSDPAYATHRDDYYDDFTNTPDEYPIVTGTAPSTFAWARLGPVDDNYKVYQFGKPPEVSADVVGDSDCDAGVYFPVTGPGRSYAYTPMSVMRDGQCVDGGYIAAYRAEKWGAPLSPTRVRKCDDVDRGIPASESPRGNLICKISPHVAIVYQRYVFGPGPTPTDTASGGCEALVYAWGWEEPRNPSSGQDYETLFRNGELRYSRWLGLSSQIAQDLPAPDDHAWWGQACERAWSDKTHWLYAGLYKIGYTVYTDSISLPLTAVAVIPTGGGRLTSTIDNVTYAFPPGTFTDTVIATHTIHFQSDAPSTGRLVGINRFFELSAVYSDTGRPAHATRPYTIIIQYSDADKGAAIEDTLALYYWGGNQWIKEPTTFVLTGTVVLTGTNVVYTDVNQVVATPNRFSLWGVLGETRGVFLPMLTRNYH